MKKLMHKYNRAAKLFVAAIMLFVIPAAACAQPDGVSRYVDMVQTGAEKTDAGKIDWGDKKDKQGMLSFSVNVHVTVSESSGVGNLLLVNPQINDMYIIAEYYLKDASDTLIYRSPEIPPDSFIENATLLSVPEKGEYDAICYLLGFTGGEMPEYAGKVGVNIKLTVI